MEPNHPHECLVLLLLTSLPPLHRHHNTTSSYYFSQKAVLLFFAILEAFSVSTGGCRGSETQSRCTPDLQRCMTPPFESNVRRTALKPAEPWSFSPQHGDKKALEVPGIRDIYPKAERKKVWGNALAFTSKE